MNENVESDKKKNPIQWLKVRAVIEEACEVIFFVGGLTLTALIVLGILPWGALGIGICATLAFIGITRFIATNSWTSDHNFNYDLVSSFTTDLQFERNRLCEILKFYIIPVISLIAGVILTALGVTEILSLGLGLSLGIPLLGASVVGVINMIVQKTGETDGSLDFQYKDNRWGMCMGIFAIIATATFLGLGFGGILALPTAIALAAPLCILAVGIGLLTLFAWSVNKYGPAKLKGWLKDMDGEISCLGFGYFKDKSHDPNQIDENYDENINMV